MFRLCCEVIYVFLYVILGCFFFFFKQKTAYEMRISDWSSTCALPIWYRATGYTQSAWDAGQDCEVAGTVRIATVSGIHDTYKVVCTSKIGRASCRERVCQYV